MKMRYIIVFLVLALFSCKKDDETQNEENENTTVERNDNAIKITNSAPQSSQNPCFSPDGQYIVFTRFPDDYNGGSSEIVKIRVDGTDEQILVPTNHSNNVNVPFGSWVGNKICFASDRAGQADEIWTINDDGSNLQQITTHSETGGVYYIEPVFNPQNNNQIVFEYVTGEDDNTAIHQIAFLDVETGSVSLLTDGTYDDRLPSWSNDGNKILFQRNNYGQEDGWRVYVANISTAPTISIDSLRMIFFGKGEYTDCSWSYNDEYILSSNEFGNEMPNIWMFPLDNTKSPIRITNTETNEDGAPTQSHDGNIVAFESHLGNLEDKPSEIWIVE